jgi:hypothetical protein
LCGMIKYRIFYAYIKGMKRIAPLDYVGYDKAQAEKELNDKFGWQKYENKHYENIFTRFYEGYYLPIKFGYDKRKCYFSNLILTGQMTREEALKQLQKNPYEKNLMEEDKQYIAKKLRISVAEFENIIAGSNKTYLDYRNSYWLLQFFIDTARLLGVEKRTFR